MTPAGKLGFRIELPVRNEWDAIEKIRASVMECCTAVFRDVEHSTAIANVAGELMENAVKFGHWSEEGNTHFLLRIWGDDAVAHIEVQSPVDPNAPDLSELLGTVASLRVAKAADVYRKRLVEDSRGPRGMSKLGLARVAYEGDCALEAEIVGGWVKVLATTRLRTP
jgi:hypothetical protein